MHDVLNIVEYDIAEVSRLARETLTLLSTPDASTSPIRYRTVLEQAIRIRTLWASHMHLSEEMYSFIAVRDPHFRNFLNNLAFDQQHLAHELKLLTPAIWPRSSELGLNSLRIRAFHVLPQVMQELEREKLTVVPVFRRWVYGGAIANAAIEQQGESMSHESTSA